MQRIFWCFLIAGSLGMSNVQAQATGTTGKQTQVAQGETISGTVKDAASGKTIAGISVAVPGKAAAITDANGSFSINIPDGVKFLQVSGEGYQVLVVPVKGRKTLDISLMDDSHESVYESVNTPMGSAMRNEMTAAVSPVRLNGAWDIPFEIPDAALQGKVSGLNVTRRSGSPGVGGNMMLRGFTSLYASNKPLIVIDNMIYDYNDYGESIIANNYTNPLALLDVKDIDHYTILKDASSIYGTKGANGAIIITTSRAKQQATKIDFGAYAGMNLRPQALPVMNSADYRVYLSEMLQSKGLSADEIAALPYMNDDPTKPGYYASHNNTNWQDNVYKNSINQNYFLKVTGGDNIATYALSLGFLDNGGIVRNTDLKRYNTRFNAEMNFSKRLTGSANLSFAYNEQNIKDQGIAPNTNPEFLSLVKAPFFTDREVNDEGKISPNLADVDLLGVGNPSALINNMQGYNKYYRFYGSYLFRYQFSDKVAASTLFGVTYDKVRENMFVPRNGVKDDTIANAVLESRLGAQVKRLFSTYSDTRVTYDNLNSRHHLNATLGMRYQNNQAEQDIALGFNSPIDELVSVQNGVNLLRQVTGGVGDWNWMNIYGAVDYSYLKKLYLSFNLAMDASSRFGKQAEQGIKIGDVPFAIMPSLSAAYLVSAEDFMQGSTISLLRLRASYGMTGNDDIGNYSSKGTYVVQNLLGMQGLVRGGIANPALQWESISRMNFGLDLGLINDRVQFTADFWRNKTTKMLVYEDLATATGMKSVLTNGGDMATNGIDLSLNVRAVNKPGLKWDIGVFASTYKNNVINVPGGSFTTSFAGAGFITSEGNVANQYYGLQSNGVYSTSQEAASAGLMRKMADGSLVAFGAGDVRYIDMNGDRIIDDNDRTAIGDPNPSWYGGINSRLQWNRFTLQALFTFSAGNDAYNYLRHQLSSLSNTNNMLEVANNRWRTEGQVTTTPKATYNDPMGNADFSDRWIEDASYLRLRTLSLSYQVPVGGQGLLKDLNIYASGNNLLTFTKYLGYDPEFSVNPSVFAQGIDTGLTPQFRSVMFGVKIGL